MALGGGRHVAEMCDATFFLARAAGVHAADARSRWHAGEPCPLLLEGASAPCICLCASCLAAQPPRRSYLVRRTNRAPAVSRGRCGAAQSVACVACLCRFVVSCAADPVHLPRPCVWACVRARGGRRALGARPPAATVYDTDTGRASERIASRLPVACVQVLHLLYPELRVCAVSCLCRLLVPVFLSALRKTRVRERQATGHSTPARTASAVTAHPRPDRRTATQTSGGHDRNKIHTHAIKLTQ